MTARDNAATSPLAGKIAVVTGTTQGLGEAIARAFVGAGAAGLVLCGRGREKGEALARDIERQGCRAVFIVADLSCVEDCRAVIAAADRHFGRCDALVNAAGSSARGTILDTSQETYDAIFATNTRGPFFLMQEAILLMRRDRVQGAIVNIQSMAAHGGQAFICAYSASKAALAALTRNVAHAMVEHRIRVNGLNIGWMATPGENAVQRRSHGAQDGWLEEAARSRPFGRLIDPAEIARACVYLASSESGLLTGANIDFDQTIVGVSDVSLPVPA